MGGGDIYAIKSWFLPKLPPKLRVLQLVQQVTCAVLCTVSTLVSTVSTLEAHIWIYMMLLKKGGYSFSLHQTCKSAVPNLLIV